MLSHQRHILKRLIFLRGQKADVYRDIKNEFGEPAGWDFYGTIRGIFHEANGYLGSLIAEAGTTYTSKQPMFLIEHTKAVREEDTLHIGERKFRVTGVDDLGNLGMFLDLSLEVI